MSLFLEFIFVFMLTCVTYLGVSTCPTFIRSYLDERNCMQAWVFVFLLLSSAFIVVTSIIGYAYLFKEITGIEFQHRMSVGSGFLTAIYFMIWINNRKK